MRRWRVLIVEDEASARRALHAIFTRRGWEVAEAGTVSEGLAALDPAPDCAVLDLMLPDGDGEAILRRVRDAELPTRVVVCTGISDPGRMTTLLAMKPGAVLQKPIRLADLLAACRAEPADA